MIPYITTPLGNIPTFTVFVVIGVLSMILAVHLLLSKSEDRDSEEVFIFPKLVLCGGVAFFFAGLFDSAAKIKEFGGFRIAGISFYGGLIGFAACFYILLKCTKASTQYAINEWYDLLTLPLIAFHFFGRLGCFFGGCCYGKNTDGMRGVLFPDNADHGIFHNGIKCYPTQLFEAAALIVIFIVCCFVAKRFEAYLLLYSISRFVIEYFRGDERGYLIELLSPAQCISVVVFFTVTVRVMYKRMNRNSRRVSP